MMWPGAPVIVISVPAISMGLKSAFFVVPNVYQICFQRTILQNPKREWLLTVVPAKVTVDPALKPVRSIVELAGAEILSRTISVQEATADVI
jgi:hypothetical protein